MNAPDRSPSRSKPRVHRQTVKALAVAILKGEIAAGEPLGDKGERYAPTNISRSALREASKVLAEKGLVSARPRVGTVVRPREDWNLLDADLLAWSLELGPDPDLVLSLLAARQVIEPAAARFAALRATDEDLARLDAAFGEMEVAKSAGAFERFNEADIRFHRALLKASKNVVFQQLSDTIGAALGYSFRISAERAKEPGSSLPVHGELIDCIRRRDPAAAQATMTRLLDIAILDLGLGAVP